MKNTLACLGLLALSMNVAAQRTPLQEKIDAAADKIESKTIAWRREPAPEPGIGQQ